MYTEMVGRRGYSLTRFADLRLEQCREDHGLYPRKGAIAPGSDADIAVLDPALRRVIRKEDLHETDYSPWEGHQVDAWPSMTLLRGKVVVENGHFHGKPADGQWLHRRIADEILTGTAL